MLTPYSSYVGRKYAAYKLENNLNLDLPRYPEITNNNYEFCDFLLQWKPTKDYLVEICNLWDKTSYIERANKKYWADDIIEYYRQGLIEIFVHKKLKENLIKASEICLDDEIFERAIKVDYLLPVSVYKCLAIAFEMKKPEDIIFTYIHAKSIFGSTKDMNRRWMNKYTLQDMKDNSLPKNLILKDKTNET